MAIISTSIAFYTAHRGYQLYQYQYSCYFIGPLRKMLNRSGGLIHFNVAFLRSMSKPRWPNAKEWGLVVCGTQKQHYLLAKSTVMQMATTKEIRLLYSHPITDSVSTRSVSNRNCDVYLRISISPHCSLIHCHARLQHRGRTTDRHRGRTTDSKEQPAPPSHNV
jgi:hypothetical protein